MKILYLGQTEKGTTSLHRRDAIQRLGHSVDSYDPWISLSRVLQFKSLEFLIQRTGYLVVQYPVLKSLIYLRTLKRNTKYDLIWVNGGELFGQRILKVLRSFGCPIILYNNDDPTGDRDYGRFLSLQTTLKDYDLIATVRNSTQRDLIAQGCRNVMRVWMSYDEIAHAPMQPSETVPSFYLTDTCFIGTWMRHEKRHIFLRKLVNENLRLHIYGPRWGKCGDPVLISSFLKKPYLCDREYIYAINGAKISIGFLSKGNRDQHTTRTFEIPFAGGLLCAERTPEHLQLFREDQDAVFWKTPEELVYQCKRLLGNDQLRERIRLSGMARVRQLGVGNETICQLILERARQCQPGC